MSSYTIPLLSAFISFAVIAFFITLPWAIYQYRTSSNFNFRRSALFFSFIYYCLAAFFIVMMPFPESRNNSEFKNHIFTQLKPFTMFENFRNVPGFQLDNLDSYPVLFRSFTFLEVIFNLILLLPLGMYLRLFLRKNNKWPLALLIIFSVTLFFELSQLTGLFGYYTYPYRVFDVNDLLTNTVGGLLGFFFAPALRPYFKDHDTHPSKDKKALQTHVVAYHAQIVEVGLTLFFSCLISGVLSFCFFYGHFLFMLTSLTFFILVVIVPRLANGWTLGSPFLHVRINLPGTDKNRPLIMRFVLLYTPLLLTKSTQLLTGIQTENPYILFSQVGLFLFTSFYWLIFLACLFKGLVQNRANVFFNDIPQIDFMRD